MFFLRENELVPRAETYLAMACGYAENDNMEMMKQVGFHILHPI